MTFRLVGDDAIEAMQAMAENSVDAIVTDPPYGLEFMGKEWDTIRPTFDNWNDAKWNGAGLTDKSATQGGIEAANGRPSLVYKANLRCSECGKWQRGGSPCVCDVPRWEPRPNQRAWAMQEWHHAWATEALRILKPGGHLLAFGGTRTYHRLACAIEDAGFEIRDCIAWMYGSGFPKSLDVSKAIDKAAGAEREVVGHRSPFPPDHPRPNKDLARMAAKRAEGADSSTSYRGSDGANLTAEGVEVTAPATPEAQRWTGWGTALKPAFEPIVLARKPLSERNVAANVQRWGTGALNIDGCRIETEDNTGRPTGTHGWQQYTKGFTQSGELVTETHPAGRWPANVTLGHSPECEPTDEVRKVKGSAPASGPTLSHLGDSGIYGKADGDRNKVPSYADADGLESVPVWKCVPGCAVAMLDEQTGERPTPGTYTRTAAAHGQIDWNPKAAGTEQLGYGDTGGASRFFYCPKADREERNRGLGGERSSHPTVKPVELMRWLCRMVTPKGGTVLDPFTGSGSTGVAAMREGFEFIGIEREAEYVEIARARIFGDQPLFNVEVGGPTE